MNTFRTIFRSLFFLSFIALSFACGNEKENYTDKKVILEKMTLSNKYFMDKWSDPGKTIITNRERVSNIWTRAVYYEGLMALYELDPKPEYLDYAVRWGEHHEWNLRNGNTFTRNADNHCCGQTYIDLYLLDKKPERIKYIKMSVDSMLNTTKIDDWWWIDALQMAMPVFAKLGVVYNDTAYFERMFDMYMYTKTVHGNGGLYNPEDHLWWRDSVYKAPYKEPDGEDCYWSRGNGWIVAALVRVLDIMPENAAHREEYTKTLTEMIEALVPVQREDGFWNVSLHDPDNYGGRETTGTSLFVYGMAYCVNKGILPAEKYKPIIEKAWSAMLKDALHENGFLGYVQSTGADPSTGQPVTYDKVPDFEDYGLGCFLLAGYEVYKMK